MVDQRTTYTWDPVCQSSRVVKLGCGYPANITYDSRPNAGKVRLMELKADEPIVVEPGCQVPENDAFSLHGRQRHVASSRSAIVTAPSSL